MQQTVDALWICLFKLTVCAHHTGCWLVCIFCVRLLRVCSFNYDGQCEGLQLWNGHTVWLSRFVFNDLMIPRGPGIHHTIMKRLLLKRTSTRWLLTLVLLCTYLSGFALRDGESFTFDGVKYTVISEADKTCKAVGLAEYNVKDLILPSDPNGYKLTSISDNAFSKQKTLISVTIPQGVTTIGDKTFNGCSSLMSVTIPQGLTSIGKWAFQDCTSLSSIELPQSLTSIEAYTFSSCKSLSKIVIPPCITSIGNEAFFNCTALTSIDLPTTEITIGQNAFKQCKSLTAVTIPEGVNTIEYGTFEGCAALASINLPQSVTSINSRAFMGCTSLVSLTIPNGVTSIGNSAFSGCSALASLIIPPGVTSIGGEAFSDCTSLSSMIIPQSVTSMERNIFKKCTINPLIFEGYYTTPYYGALTDLKDKSLVLCRLPSLNALKLSGFSKVYSYDSMYDFSIDPMYFGCKIKVKDNPYCTTTCSDYKISIKDKEGKTVTEVNVVKPETQEVSGLQLDTEYTAVISWLSEGEEAFYFIPFKTYKMYAYSETNITATSITIKYVELDSYYYLDANVTEKGIIYNGDKHIISNGKRFVIDNLYPNETINYTIYVNYDGGKIEYKRDVSATTQNFSGSIDCQTTPTTATLSGNLGNMSGITPDRMWWDIGTRKDVFTGEKAEVTSLDPDTKTNVSFHFSYTPEGRETRQYAVNSDIRTSALVLKTLQPKCVSEKCAIVAASTNMSDDEIGAGFEWKKYDAPSSLTPSSGSAVVYEGMLEGYIRNLQPTSYYNVRAFYKSDSGKYWYGDWVTFDPSDFSYFEPTVRTYPAENITSTSAKVKGYALPGTDQITSQGFQYWKTGSSPSKKIMRIESDINTIIATGQVMIATFDDLEPDTQYTYRVFVETEQGFTYGDEQTFTTEADTGVDSVNSDDNEVCIVGYYNLMGLRSDHPHKGINIVVYSNGKTKKIHN